MQDIEARVRLQPDQPEVVLQAGIFQRCERGIRISEACMDERGVVRRNVGTHCDLIHLLQQGPGLGRADAARMRPMPASVAGLPPDAACTFWNEARASSRMPCCSYARPRICWADVNAGSSSSVLMACSMARA